MKNILVLICALLLTPVALYGQNDCPFNGPGNDILAQLEDTAPVPPPFGRFGGPPEGRPFGKEGMKRIEQLRLIKLLELLNLDEERENKFIPLFRSHSKNQRVYVEERENIIKKMAQGIRKGDMGDPEIMNLIDELKKLDKQSSDEFKEFTDNLQSFLTPAELGKIYIFQARFGAEVLDRMRDLKRREEGWGRNKQLNKKPNDSN